eukprot:CAMPEP_0171630060 /NCGR_PEP_ID=MMETSP0990-20121206/22635_1 /TAXON_ID=483369 /ORGANISM="non described non described, Strain CCMP2098" /LENGTH=137 /DNA_ID=CAMNT_0012199019 /DNA_START=139 /DNA_END=552 /DNA_ORIENTATION=+
MAMANSDHDVTYGGIHHVGVLVADAPSSVEWYLKVLGFEDESHLRPTKLPYPGAFLRAGTQQLHLMQLPNPDPIEGRPAHGGRDRHAAFSVASLDPLVARLEASGLKQGDGFTLSMSGRRALFCRDPDGNAFEFMEV